MDTGSLTEKSREALQEAQNVATRMGHTEVDGEHLLLALVDQQDGLVPRLLEQAGANVDALRSDLERELSRRPKVSGPGATPGQVTITQRLAKLLDAAKKLGAKESDTTYPSWADNSARRALVDFGWPDPAIPIRVDTVILTSKPHDWVGNAMK